MIYLITLLTARKCFLQSAFAKGQIIIVQELRLCKTLVVTTAYLTFLPPLIDRDSLAHDFNPITIQPSTKYYCTCNAASPPRLLLSLLLRRPRHPVNERVLTIPHLMETRRRRSNAHDPLSRKIRRGSS